MGEHNCYKSNAEECIRKKAYELWEKDGCKQDRGLDYWLIAEKIVNDPIKKQQAKNRA